MCEEPLFAAAARLQKREQQLHAHTASGDSICILQYLDGQVGGVGGGRDHPFWPMLTFGEVLHKVDAGGVEVYVGHAAGHNVIGHDIAAQLAKADLQAHDQ